ncbi:DNA protecting protein DprA [Kribbella rubisoli]|uniref:DNA protecting protein DprA n=1 Tax=Kribbella rubisoli TaxID=3075929 RepID=A0A4Q7W2W9_9ACTN|nr:DNA-processing protein DprA [Kribbella rubisoli]RZU03582.1 DNA protecting protein DprA [Kribbella rubisoli]
MTNHALNFALTNLALMADAIGSGGGAAGSEVIADGNGDRERLARAGLSRVVEPGDLAALKAFDGMSALEIWDRLQCRSHGLERWSTRLAEVDPERDLERAAAAGARFVIPGDDEWPDPIDVLTDAGQLSRRAGAPFGLWVRGRANLRHALKRSVSVVGARACSSYGEHVAAELSAGLADSGVTVVSGGAFGIDAAAHRGALAAPGTTIAVLACGVDVSYPKRNSALLSRVAEEGLVVAELPPGCSPTKLRFLARNRLIAAATQGTVVIEAAIRSGALNTAGWAEQCGRAVLAVPGPVTSRMSAGSHLLVRERNAVLATNVADIIEAISPYGAGLTQPPRAPQSVADTLDADLQRTLDAVPVLHPAPAPRIAVTAGLDLLTTQQSLDALAALALITQTPTGWRLPSPPGGA